ncbi:tetratricopeptide repeat-containing sensor histidine kinase [Neotamlana laminarinivorans]|uniref:histidine kinase n=1 Tax=Neotamlana laminarinivorans TaxID=2883124 RepID=A0A9X1L1W4_9FLAO|nr:tetratricopeptide repeat-containing sensor histidine kinase [Tamlana laminarinivorans]MCB4799155.1 tetratricopeptide repeat protein [Tamlana laminarinivorans]
MIKIIYNYLFFSILFCSPIASSQTDVNRSKFIPNKNELTEEENNLINNARDLLNNNEVEKFYKTAHYLKKHLVTKKALSNVNILLAYYFKNQTLIDSSNYYVHEAFKHVDKKNDSTFSKFKALTYNILGVNYKNKGLFNESKKWHLKAIEESLKYNEVDFYYQNTHGLALTYSQLGEYKKALKLFKECLNYHEDKEVIFGSYINIGMIYSEIKNYSLAEEYFAKGKELSQKENNHQAIAVIALNQGANAQKLNHYKKAINLYQEALKISEEQNFKNLQLVCRLNIGNVFLLTKNYKESELIFSLALNDAKELGFFSQQLDILKSLKDIALEQNNHKNAYIHLNHYFNIKDSIAKLQKNKELNELEVRYETLKKEKEIKILKIENSNRKLKLKNQEEAIKNLKLQQEIKRKENENKILAFKHNSIKKEHEINLLKRNQEIKDAEFSRQKIIKNVTLISFIIILIPIIALLIIYYQKLQTQSELNQKQQEINEQKISSLLKDQELAVIKASILGQDKERKRIAQELHDSIGGNLAAIKLQITNTNNTFLKAINKQLDDTYLQVRSLSHNLIPKKFKRNNFADVLEEYLNNIGNGTGLTTHFQAYPRNKINTINQNLQIQIFKIIQELITNTIKHAKANTIDLQIGLSNNNLNILFEDNGIGFNSNIDEGIGLKNIKNRLYDINGTLNIDSRKNRGTIINIEINNMPPTTS